MSSPKDLLDYLRKDECYLENGHFKLVSGKHSDSYIQVRIGMMNPDTSRAFASALARKLSDLRPTMVAASTVGGILLAIDTARMLDVPLLVGQQVAGKVEWVDSKKLDAKKLKKVVLVDDILTTGGSLYSAIQSLMWLGASIATVAVAVDRSGGKESNVQVDGVKHDVLSLVQLSLNLWDPSNCPICPQPYVNLHNPEQDFLSVILSMPPQKADMIINGYRKAYELQNNREQVQMIDFWKPWLPSLLAGLPIIRVGEDSGLAQFIRLIQRDELHMKRKRVFTELVGHLLAVSNIRVEARSLGCSILIGDEKRLHNILPMKVPIEVPSGIKSGSFAELIPHYDALLETEAVFLFDKDGELVGISRLVRSIESGETRGIQLIRQVTNETDAIGLVLRRERKAIAVYRKGRLEAIAELSEKTGTWEFTTPVPKVDEIVSLVPGIGQTLETVLEVSREMVNRGYGGLFVIGDIPATLQRKPPKIKMEKIPIVSLGIGMATEIAKLDGAMLISRDGEIQDASVIIVNSTDLEPHSDTSDISRSSKTGGSRRETARRTSLECPDSAVVCVSQNGTIEIFVRGNSWPVSEAITGVPR
jgi:orotate phosphoribosyltransferase